MIRIRLPLSAAYPLFEGMEPPFAQGAAHPMEAQVPDPEKEAPEGSC